MTQARPMIPAYPALSRSYDAGFRVDDAYKAGLPDLQNGPASLIVGARAAIQHVGISNFRLPIRYQTRDGGEITLETSGDPETVLPVMQRLLVRADML